MNLATAYLAIGGAVAALLAGILPGRFGWREAAKAWLGWPYYLALLLFVGWLWVVV